MNIFNFYCVAKNRPNSSIIEHILDYISSWEHNDSLTMLTIYQYLHIFGLSYVILKLIKIQ